MERQLNHALLGILLVTGLYASIYAGSTLYGAALSDASVVAHVTGSITGWGFLASVGAWIAILGGWKLDALRRDLRRDPGAVREDEVVTNLREAQDERG